MPDVPNRAAEGARPLKFRRTRIVATLGPASSDPTTIAALINAGVDVFRLNMSHGEHAGHRRTYAAIRAAAERQDAHIAVLADLSGPKIRVGRFAGGGIELAMGATVIVTVRDVEGGPGLIPSQYAELAGDVKDGDRILLDDGNLELRVEAVDGTEIRCTVVAGGRLSDRKGMNLPGVAVSAPALTPKDRADAAFAVELGVDLLALSFVRSAADVEALRALIAPLVRSAEDAPALIAKIEKPEALDAIDAILDAADGIMVARGDLGVELPPERVPMAQEMLVNRARARRRPVIVATQMLESMIERPRPTRAEVSDVAGAVRSGADAVMLSGETAVGAYPVAAVRMMDKIAREAEGWQWSHGAFGGLTGEDERGRPLPVNAAVSLATAHLSRDLEVRAIVALSRSGSTTAIMSAARPAAPLVAASPSLHLRRVSRLLWGTRPVAIAPADFDDAPAFARRIAVELGFAEAGQCVLLVRGFSDDPACNMPSITTLTV